VKVGTLAYAVDQGLGILAKSFVDHGIVTDILVVEHYSRPRRREWYPDAPTTPMNPFNGQIARDFIRSMDAMLFFETPFDWSLLPFCKEHGIPTVLMPMYECMPTDLPHQPDWFICPSSLDQQHYPEKSTLIPVPVGVPWKLRKTANVFVHNAGNLGLRCRNGTPELAAAMKHVKSPLQLIIRSQCGSMNNIIRSNPHLEQDSRVTIKIGTIPYEDLWVEGDVFVFPEKFNGLSLPIQEARAAGMLVMSTDRFPVNTWVPPEPLIPTVGSEKARVGARTIEFDESIIDPEDIAKTMDAWFGKNIESYSQSGKYWAEEMSWEAVGPQYTECISKLVEGEIPR
jgi:hypothetical protein